MNNILQLFLGLNVLVQISICILVVCSTISWSVIFYRIFILSKEKYQFDKFENQFWSGIELPNLYQDLSMRRNRLSVAERIFYIGFKEFSKLFPMKKYYSPEIITNRISKVMYNSMNMDLENLGHYIPLIGTIGSVSPYIGLFGTVLGIIHVFIEIGKRNFNQLGNIQIIAPGISEALISTAIGLFVAIPAVIAFNYLTAQINNLDQNFNNFIEEFISILCRQIFLNLDTDTNQDIQYAEKISKKIPDSI